MIKTDRKFDIVEATSTFDLFRKKPIKSKKVNEDLLLNPVY